MACQEDVGGFEVAVNDAQVVKGLQRADDLTFNCQGLRGVDRVSEEALRQGLALEQLQDETQTLTFFEDVENLADVGMIHAGQGTRLAPKPAVGFFALACFVNGLYSDWPFEAIIPRLVHNPHCALANLAPDPIMANCFQLAVMIVPQEGPSNDRQTARNKFYCAVVPPHRACLRRLSSLVGLTTVS